jgi:hypothetical protein
MRLNIVTMCFLSSLRNPGRVFSTKGNPRVHRRVGLRRGDEESGRHRIRPNPVDRLAVSELQSAYSLRNELFDPEPWHLRADFYSPSTYAGDFIVDSANASPTTTC